MASSPRPATRSPATPASARPIIDIQAWTTEVEQTTQSLSAAHLSPPPVTPSRSSRPSPSVRIAIPLDLEDPSSTPDTALPSSSRTHHSPSTPRSHHRVHNQSTPVNRASLKRRESLLKGKEGSRARRRWENDRLLSNPHAVPPSDADWDIAPGAVRETFPYFLAPVWDAELRLAREARELRARDGDGDEQDRVGVSRLVRRRIKRSRAAKGLLEDLEGRVREFIVDWERGVGDDDGEKGSQEEEEQDDGDEEELVFVGRDAIAADAAAAAARNRDRHVHDSAEPDPASEHTPRREKLVFDSPVEDHGAAFGYVLSPFSHCHLWSNYTDQTADVKQPNSRWLVHSIATYYGLDTYSVTTGDPARREAYVAVKTPDKIPSPIEMPRPLWGLV